MASERRWHRATLLAVVVAVLPTYAATPPPRVALVMSSEAGPFIEASTALQQRLAGGAYAPEFLLFDLASSEAAGDRVRRDLRDAKPAVIVTIGTLATRVVLHDTWDVPIVYSMVLHPQASGIEAGPGRQVTGAMLDLPLAMQFETVRTLVPAGKRVGVVYAETQTGDVVAAARAAAKTHGFTLVPIAVERPSDVLRAVEHLLPDVDLLWSVADPVVFTEDTTSGLILATLRARIPYVGLSAAQVRSGALAALSCDYADVGAQTAELVERLLGGTPARSVRPTTPRRTELHLNLRTARHIGLELPSTLVDGAATVVR